MLSLRAVLRLPVSSLLPLLLAPYLLLAGRAAAGPLVFDEIARDLQGGVGAIDAGVRPALANDGTVAFAGTDTVGDEAIFVGSGGPVSAIDVDGNGYTGVSSVQIRSAGDVVFVAERTASPDTYRGAYATDTAGNGFATLYEGNVIVDPSQPPVGGNVSLSPNGTVAVSSILNGNGAIHSGAVAGPVSELRAGNGTFFNTKRLDVNDAGTVAVQMEYADPTKGLSRGILLFDAPGQALTAIDTAVEKLGIGAQPDPAINASGQVAFALNAPATLTFYDPPHDSGGSVAAVLNLTAGVYVATPTLFGQPSDLLQIADASGPYNSFGAVDIDAAGHVVFEADFAFGGGGLFAGPDPVADRILATGDTLGGHLVSAVSLGEQNDSGQLTLVTIDGGTGVRSVWRVSAIPEPASLHMMGTALVALGLWRRRSPRRVAPAGDQVDGEGPESDPASPSAARNSISSAAIDSAGAGRPMR